MLPLVKLLRIQPRLQLLAIADRSRCGTNAERRARATPTTTTRNYARNSVHTCYNDEVSLHCAHAWHAHTLNTLSLLRRRDQDERWEVQPMRQTNLDGELGRAGGAGGGGIMRHHASHQLPRMTAHMANRLG